MKVKIVTNFRDYYDHHFDNPYLKTAKEFRRMDNEGMNRIEMFEFFKKHEICCPKNGYVREFTDLKRGIFVVYKDINSHRGENKIMVPIKNAIEHFPDNYCSHYIHSGAGAESYRLLNIGKRQFVLKYNSDDKFRSNVGDVNIQYLGELSCYTGKINNIYPFGYFKIFDIPLYAIDFVFDLDANCLTAVDFNIAPKLSNTPIEEMIDGDDIVQLIREYYERKVQRDKIGNMVHKIFKEIKKDDRVLDNSKAN